MTRIQTLPDRCLYLRTSAKSAVKNSAAWRSSQTCTIWIKIVQIDAIERGGTGSLPRSRGRRSRCPNRSASYGAFAGGEIVWRISEDRTFSSGVTTIFNNDHDNSAKLGAGTNLAYVETSRGRLIDGRSTRGRYIRLYSNGNTSDSLNHYCEVEIYGEPWD